MPTELDALRQHLDAFLPAIHAGCAQAAKRKAAGALTGHAYLEIMGRKRAVDLIVCGLWGHRAVGKAFEACAGLTNTIAEGLAQPGVAATLRDRGFTDPLAGWRAPFHARGMTASGPNGPTWPYGTSC